jgi:hypothetical protein
MLEGLQWALRQAKTPGNFLEDKLTLTTGVIEARGEVMGTIKYRNSPLEMRTAMCMTCSASECCSASTGTRHASIPATVALLLKTVDLLELYRRNTEPLVPIKARAPER